MSVPLELLPKEARERSIDLRPHGEDTEAIPLDLAFEACRIFAQADYAILGGEYWDSTPLGVERTYEVWGVTPWGQETWAEYVERSRVQAETDLHARGGQAGAYVSLSCVTEDGYRRLPMGLRA
jgi:hypothetical protein